MKKALRLLLLGAFCAGFMACQKGESFVYHVSPPQVALSPQIKDIGNNGKVDMLWVIGGMSEQAQNFQAGVTDFMDTFVRYKNINWKMGVISTDPSYAPFLGMGGAGVFDAASADPGPTLVNAVMTVLQSYDGEKLFDPTIKALKENKDFIRTDATLAIILTNDAHDGSIDTIQAQDMIKFLIQTKQSLRKVVVYGIFGATDLACPINTIDEDWNYKGSPMETLIKITGGEGLSLCNSSFGTLLAQISNHLMGHILQPTFYLSQKPVVATIQVSYKGTVLPGGTKEKGGYWVYNLRNNSIVFHDLSFVTSDTDTLDITYTEDIGITN